MADLLTFVDIQAQAPQQNVSNSNNNNSSGEPGVFDALMKEYTAPEDLEAENVSPALNEANLIAFKGSKLFSGSVLEILAESSAPENLETLNISEDSQNLIDELKISLGKVKDFQPEVLYEDDEIKLNEEISQLLALSDDELEAKLATLPEDLKAEIKNLIDEINNALKNGGDISAIKSSVEKLTTIVANDSKIAPKDEKDEKISNDDENKIKTDEGQELELISTQAAGLAVANVDNKITESNAKSEPEKNLDVKDSTPRQNFRTPVQNQTTPRAENDSNEISNNETTDADEKPASNFDKLLRQNGENKNSESESGNENENQDSNFNQASENFSDSRNGSRSRNEHNRRVSNNNTSRENESNSNSTAHRTDSRNDFQNFFEGVLNSRRTSGTSGTSTSQPLDLRGNFNLNQSETLRNGLVNVVRFIRADGVQKASVVVDPPALGRISVELTSSSSGVEASIKVASEQIRQLVQDQLTQLRMNLSEQGVQVAEFTVDVQQDNQQGGNSQNENQRDNRENFVAGLDDNDDDTEEFRVDLEEGLLYWVA
ncbi:MAG: flagellar hook-length control protein FliK [Synergistaceae bacterium]|nr:flagellar hook-length control protein FliK [Synergistaceae bacterium]